jgi:hypothetical protein
MTHSPFSDIPDGPSLMATKKDALARFIHLILPLAEIYKIPPKSLQVFHDVSGGLIAFNSSGSIFLNLRFYEEWRTLILTLPCHARSDSSTVI